MVCVRSVCSALCKRGVTSNHHIPGAYFAIIVFCTTPFQHAGVYIYCVYIATFGISNEKPTESRSVILESFGKKNMKSPRFQRSFRLWFQVGNTSRKHKNEVLKWVADTWPGLSQRLVRGRTDIVLLLSHRISARPQQRKFAKFQSPSQSSHPHPPL